LQLDIEEVLEEVFEVVLNVCIAVDVSFCESPQNKTKRYGGLVVLESGSVKPRRVTLMTSTG